MPHNNPEWKFRRNSLRLQRFDYSYGCSFVTIVAKDRRRFFTDKRIAKSTIETLLDLRIERKFNLYTYCLMPDHLHALIGVGESGLTLGRICGEFKSLSTRKFWNFHDGKLWQREFYDHVIRNEEDFVETVKYIRLNPVRAKLVESWKDWPYTGEPNL
ncbi:MAG: transposase [Pyrinomonadaceae bacterium]